MPIYKYEALKNGKNVVKGEIVANDLKDAREIIRKKGLVPTKVTENVQIKGKQTGSSVKSLSLKDKIDFISTLQILIQSGVPAVESLMFMEQEGAKKSIREVSKMLKVQIMSGSTLADTLARYPNLFV